MLILSFSWTRNPSTRLRGYRTVEHEPTAVRLEFHLERQHIVHYNEGDEEEATKRGEVKRTKHMAWFLVHKNMQVPITYTTLITQNISHGTASFVHPTLERSIRILEIYQIRLI